MVGHLEQEGKVKQKTWNKAHERAHEASRERAMAIVAMAEKTGNVAEAARKFGITRQRASQIINREKKRQGATTT